MTEEQTKLTPEELNDITIETMLGDLMKLTLDEIKAIPDVWQKLGEIAQQDVIDRVHMRTKEAIEKAVHLIASEGRKTIVGDLEQITIKDGYKAVINIRAGDPNRHELTDSVRQPVLIVVGGVDQYAGGTDEIQAEKDQKVLEFSGENDPLYDKAVDHVRATRNASVGGLQRELKVGFNRASRLIETMEKSGIVSAIGKDGARTVLTA